MASQSEVAAQPAPLIALHINSMASGGAEKMRLVIARELLRRGYRVDLVLCQTKGEYMAQIPEGVRVVDLKAPRTVNSLLPMVKYLRETRPDLMISSLGYHNTVAVLANRLAGKPTRVFVTQHNNLSSQSSQTGQAKLGLVPLLYRFVLPMADGVLAVSKGIADDMAKVAGFPRERINVLYNPAAPENLEAQAAEPVDDPFFDTDEPVVLAIGRLHAQKGFDTLIAAFAELAARRPARLAICGVGALEAPLKAQVQALGLDDRVKFLGFQANPAKYLRRADLFVLSSRFEGFGNVLVEALACGTPTVSTDCPHGPAEILDNGRYGLLPPVDDVSALAKAMADTLDNPLPSQLLVDRGLEFSPEKVVDRYLAVVRPRAA
ncbi:glycosyltransferase [Caulobacter sp. UNC358MFTsu5.1]|uniref:glycosyltransferase n=1 Tax=Caulobacter sp. UNC358MFTsu5.1 TaxID=1449049 RepID=UPI00055523B6|nr:glycosyltransferase [Caulobacter sp. UNC358MFTsu5.1]